MVMLGGGGTVTENPPDNAAVSVPVFKVTVRAVVAAARSTFTRAVAWVGESMVKRVTVTPDPKSATVELAAKWVAKPVRTTVRPDVS